MVNLDISKLSSLSNSISERYLHFCHGTHIRFVISRIFLITDLAESSKLDNLKALFLDFLNVMQGLVN